MARTQIQYGSQGSDVKELQNILNKNGYKLTVDGIFGADTQKAVKDYQQKMGLTVDGIVGTNTWSSLLGGGTGSSNNAVTSPSTTTPTLKPTPTLGTYENGSWSDSTEGKQAWDAYQDALDKVNNYGDFTYGNQEQLNAIINSILNREKFSYDLNGDALYQQYKDKYIQQGKMAMGDAIGQAQAMTGGYGSSYAQSVGQQAYQAQLQNLNDIVPELYQMALDKYNMEGQELYNQYGMLTDDYNREYGAWNDKYGRLMDAVGIARGDYYDGGDLFYTEQNNHNNVIGMQNTDALNIWAAENDNIWKGAEWERQDNRWKVEDEQWQKEFDAVYGNKTTDEDNTPGGSANPDKTPTLNSLFGNNKGTYDNAGYSENIVKRAQVLVGATPDGKWGADSAAKAKAKGYNSLAAVVVALGGSGSGGTKGYKDFNSDTYNANVQANGGSYYKATLDDLKKMKAEGKSNKEVQAYLEELVGNSIITKSEYATLYNKYRNNELG